MSIVIQAAIVETTEQVGFLTFTEEEIVAWAYSDDEDKFGTKQGRLHGTQMYFPVDTPEDEVINAVWERWQEMRREFNRLDAARGKGQ